MRTPNRFRLDCYGQPARVYPSYRIARAAAERHIRSSCPGGAMPWARRIRWHHLDQHPWMEAGVVEVWVSACGEWLNHQIVHVAAVPATGAAA